ncbi:MAG: hypothetical protein F4X76_01300 [Chloroflexi bacterium]|nr:hypothetical protein [Chloroflexota bacterium]
MTAEQAKDVGTAQFQGLSSRLDDYRESHRELHDEHSKIHQDVASKADVADAKNYMSNLILTIVLAASAIVGGILGRLIAP